MFTKLFDQTLDSFPAQALENGPEFYHTRPGGHRRPKIHAVTVFAPLKIGSGSLERAHQCFAMPAKDDAAVVRNIEGLVCVERPGVRRFDALTNFAHRWQHARPKAECAVDMNPRTRSVRAFANLADRINRSGIYVAGLGDD